MRKVGAKFIDRLIEGGDLRGEFTALIREFDGPNDKVGRLITHYKEHNLIVNTARQALAHLIAEGDPNFVMQDFAMGDGHHVGGPGQSGNILTPVAPVITETTLENELFRKAIGSFSYPAAPDITSVIFTTTIERGEANDPYMAASATAYTEFGLFTVNNTMFSIKSVPAMVKHSDREFEFIWKIIF